MKKIEGVVEKIEEQTKAVKLVGNDDWFLPNEKSKPFVNKQLEGQSVVLSVDGSTLTFFKKSSNSTPLPSTSNKGTTILKQTAMKNAVELQRILCANTDEKISEDDLIVRTTRMSDKLLEWLR